MSDYPGTGRLEPELLAAYIDGELPPEARAKVEAEIAADPENYEWLVNVMAAVDAESIPGGGTKATDHGEAHTKGEVDPEPLPAPVPEPAPKPDGGGTKKDQKIIPFYRRRSVVGAMGALAVAASVMLVVRLQPEWYFRLRGSQAGYRLATLVSVVGEQRYIEARLPGGFRFGPMRAVMRGGEALNGDRVPLLAAAGQLRQATLTSSDSDVLTAWGVAQLLQGDSGGALDTLKASLAQEKTSDVLVALSAAYIQKFREGGSRQAAENALGAAQACLEMSPGSPEARYNLALALEALGEPLKARTAWQQAVLVTDDLEWRKDAERRRDAVDIQENTK